MLTPFLFSVRFSSAFVSLLLSVDVSGREGVKTERVCEASARLLSMLCRQGAVSGDHTIECLSPGWSVTSHDSLLFYDSFVEDAPPYFA